MKNEIENSICQTCEKEGEKYECASDDAKCKMGVTDILFLECSNYLPKAN